MPRKPRFFIADLPTHIVQRGNNRQPVFFAEDDYGVYLNWLGEAADRWGCAIHAYVLMANHAHVLMTPTDTEGIQPRDAVRRTPLCALRQSHLPA